MKKLLPVLIFLLIPSATALPIPNVTFIPDKFSANASILVVADPQTSRSVRIHWAVPSDFPYDQGSFPKVGDRYICYFSQQNGTCGPSPYRETTLFVPYTMEIAVIADLNDVTNTTVTHNVGGIAVDPSLNLIGKALYINWPSAIIDRLSYKIYKVQDLSLVRENNIDYNLTLRGYVDSINLEDGEYYAAFTIDTENDFGGTLKKISVGGLAENITTPGPGAVRYVSFDPIYFVLLVRQYQSITKLNLELTNIHNETLTDLSIEVPAELTEIMSASLESNSIPVNGSVYFKITIKNVSSALLIATHLTLKSGPNQIARIPVEFSVNIQNITSEAGDVLSISKAIINKDMLAGHIALEELELENRGKRALHINVVMPSSLEELVSVRTPSTLGPGEKAPLTLEIKPLFEDRYQGSILVNTESGSETILVDILVFPDLSDKIQKSDEALQALKESLSPDQLQALETSLSTIQSLIDDSRTDLESNSYPEASRKIAEASSRIAVLDEVKGEVSAGPTSQPTDISAVVVVIVIIAGIAFALWFFLTKFRKSKQEEEEELEKEFDVLK